MTITVSFAYVIINATTEQTSKLTQAHQNVKNSI